MKDFSVFSREQISHLLKMPHLIGHLVGKDKLTALHSRWLHELYCPDEDTAMQAHRGAFKTTMLTELGIPWWLILHPDDRVCLLRETWTVANDTLRTIATYMESPLIMEIFRAVHGTYPRALVLRDGRLTYSFKGYISKEGSIDSYGIDTVPVGNHYDMILADDVVTIRDRYSRAKRERTKENIQEIRTNILDPGKRFRSVGTPWHKDDAHTLLPPPKKYDCYSTGILTPEQIEEKKKTTTPVMFAANYELTHISTDDAVFRDPTFGPWEARLVKTARGHVDARFKGSHFTAATVIGRRYDGKFFVWGKVYDQDVRHVEEDIKRNFFSRDVAVMHNETNPDKGYTADLFRRPYRGKVLCVEEYHESMNKQNKISTYIAEFWERLIFAEDCDEKYIEQVMEWRPDGKDADDAPDSLASLLREMVYPTDNPSTGNNALYQL